jgi:hypothetical protein
MLTPETAPVPDNKLYLNVGDSKLFVNTGTEITDCRYRSGKIKLKKIDK